MSARRKRFISEIKCLKLELAEANRRLCKLEDLVNLPRSITSSVTMVPECPSIGGENSFAANVAFGMSKVRVERPYVG
jgi:hypothetical protein